MVDVKEVLRLWMAGMARKRIAAQLGLDPKTVRRYVRTALRAGLRQRDGEAALTDERVAVVLVALEAVPTRPQGAAWVECVRHEATIAAYLRQGVRLTKIRKLLRHQGVDLPYATLRRFAIAACGFGRTAPTVPVADCGPGEEVQLDTGWMTLLAPHAHGRRRRVRAWIFTAVYSRYRFVYPWFGETTASAIEACEAAGAFFGGVFAVLIPHNTKAIVETADPLQPRVVAAFREYSQARGVHVDPTRVRHPRDEARVERSVPGVREDGFGGEDLRDIDAARTHAVAWCRDDSGVHVHTRTQRRPREHFDADEQAHLWPAPAELGARRARHGDTGRFGMADIGEGLAALAQHLAGRREALLVAWQRRVDDDPQITTTTTMPRSQFRDHIPDVLDDFEARLRAAGAPHAAADVAREARQDAAAHGLHRWQQGLHLREIAREWAHLHLALLEEVERYPQVVPGVPAAAMVEARRLLAQLVGEGMCESTSRYFALQQTEAEGQVRDLERALAENVGLALRQGEAWREAAHGLRGSLGVVQTVTTLLARGDAPEDRRRDMLAMLHRNVDSLQHLLEDVLSLARLQAGREQRQVQRFDVTTLLTQLAAGARPLADERGLTLAASGPPSLTVQGDATKIRRIARNLLLNALK